MSTQPFAICRVAKLKSFSNIRKSGKHTDRTQDTPNADPTQTPQNMELLPNVEKKNLETLVKEKIGALKHRKDAVLCSELLFATSPEFWRPEHPEAAGTYDATKLQPWVDANMNFAKTKYGKGLVKATLHLDEGTPHMVLYVVPLYEKDGQLRLSHKELFGGELKDRKLSQLQDDYALAMHHLGLQRGLKGSKAKHQKVKRVYGVMDEAVALQDLALPEPDPGESATAYKRRIQPFIEQLAVKAAIAPALKQEADGQRVTALSLGHRLETAKETMGGQQQQLGQQTELIQQLRRIKNKAIAEEMIVTAQLVLAKGDTNLYKSDRFVFDGRGDYLKITTLEGQCLVHNQGGTAKLTESFTPAALQSLRDGHRKIAQAAQTALSRSKDEQADLSQ